MSSPSPLMKALQIEPGEGRRTLFFAILNGLNGGGLVVGLSAADSMFLRIVGAHGIPWVYLVSSLVMLGYVPLNAAMTARHGATRVLNGTLAVLVVGNLFLGSGLPGGDAAGLPTAYGMKIWNALWWVALQNLFWNFADEYFTLQEAKRLFAIIAGCGALGAIACGVGVGLLTHFMRLDQLFLVWAVLVLASFPILSAIRAGGTADNTARQREQAAQPRPTENLALLELRRSPFARALGLLTPLLNVSLVIGEYQCMQVFANEPNAARLATILGALLAGSSLAILLGNLLLFNRMVLRYGVVAMTAVTPAAYIVAFGTLWAAFGWPAAITMTFAYRVVASIYQGNTQNLLFNAVPAETRRELRMAIKGGGDRVAMAIAAVGLLVFGPYVSTQTISLAGAAVGLLALGLVYAVGATYRRAMAENVRRDRLDFAAPPPVLVDEDDGGRLWERVRDGEPREAGEALQLLWRRDPEAATDALVAALERRPAEADRWAPAVAELLPSGDDTLVRRLGDWLAHAPLHQAPTLAEVLADHHLIRGRQVGTWLGVPDPALRAAAAGALLGSAEPATRAQALETLSQQLVGSQGEQRLALRALGRGGDERDAPFVARWLDAPVPLLRREALAALVRLAGPSSERLGGKLIAATGEADGRRDALAALAAIGDPACVRPLLARAEDFGPDERGQVARIIAGIGVHAVPAAAIAAADATLPYRSRALAVRVLGEIAPDHMESVWLDLLEAELARAYDALARGRALADARTPGAAVLARTYAERPRNVVDFALELMAVTGRVPAVEVLAASLRSADARLRGEALEAVELGLPRKAFLELVPLIESKRLQNKVDGSLQAAAVCAQALTAADPIEAAAAVQAAWDGGASPAALREVALGNPAPWVADAVVALIGRDGQGGAPTKVEVLHRLIGARPFSRLRLDALVALARDVEPHAVANDVIYLAGMPAQGAYLVRSGRVQITGGAGERHAEAGDVYGLEGLYGIGAYGETAIGEQLEGLRVPPAAIRRVALTYPDAALALLEERWT